MVFSCAVVFYSDGSIWPGGIELGESKMSAGCFPILLTDEGLFDVSNGFFDIPRFLNHHDLKPYY
jgi:hypothetical protein